jgi:hypothetical protein
MKVNIKNTFTNHTGLVNLANGSVTGGQVAQFGSGSANSNVTSGTAGTGYQVDDEVTFTAPASGTSCKIKITSVGTNGAVTEFEVTDPGSGHTDSSTLVDPSPPAGGTAVSIDVKLVGSLAFDADTAKLNFKLGALTNIIERIEYQVGTQIWQTLEKDDVRVVYNTEMSEAAFNSVSRRARPTTVGSGPSYDAADPSWNSSDGKYLDVTFIIPALTKTLAPQLETFTNISESGYPLAAAPHQSVKLKIYLANKGNVDLVIPNNESLTIGTSVTFDVKESPYLSSITYTPVYAGTTTATETRLGETPLAINSIKLYAKHIIMCNEEREQMKAMPLGLPKRLKMTQNALITDVASVLQKTIDLDHFSLYGSHLIISGNLGKDVYIKTAELKLNSSSFSGVLPAQMLDYATASSLGLYVNRNIEGTQQEAVDGLGLLVFPLGSSAYSGSSVPLNRFDSIRLSLVFTTQPTATSPYISITCVGETTALFKGGAASLAMY